MTRHDGVSERYATVAGDDAGVSIVRDCGVDEQDVGTLYGATLLSAGGHREVAADGAVGHRDFAAIEHGALLTGVAVEDTVLDHEVRVTYEHRPNGAIGVAP